MSRGLGKLQKRLIGCLKGEKWVSIYAVFCKLYDPNNEKYFIMRELSASQKQSVYRAIRSLETHELVESRIRERGVTLEEDLEVLSRNPNLSRELAESIISTGSQYSFAWFDAKTWKEIRLTPKCLTLLTTKHLLLESTKSS